MSQTTIDQLIESSTTEGAATEKWRLSDSFWWRTFFLLGVSLVGYAVATVLTLLV